MKFADVQNWLDGFGLEVCEGRRRIRGRLFSGVRLEVHARGEVVVIMDPAVEGATPDQRAISFVKDIFDTRVLEAFIPPDRFERIVAGEDAIREEDWVWDDEQ